MVSESSHPTSMFERSFGEEASETLITLPYKLNQLKKQIQAERVDSIKDKVEKNEQKLKIHVSQLISSMAAVDATTGNENGSGKMLSFRIGSSLCNYNGLAQGTGEREYFNSQEVSSSRSIKLPFIEKVPPYTAWIFLDRNQRMAEDQSVVGRRRIYYDPYSSETLICSDSEEEIIEPEEEKHEFSEGEDRIIQIAFDEYGFKEEVSNIVSQFVGGTDSEIQERYNILKEKCEEKDTQKGFGEVDCGRSVFLEKSLATSLDSFDNLFCRRCLVFDCRLHGCSQALIHPSEKPSYSPEHEEHRKPCSDQCYLQLNTFKNLPYGGPLTMGRTSLEANLESPLLTSAEGQRRNGTTGSVLCNGGIPETMVSVASADGNLEIARRDLDSDASNMGMPQQESTESSKVSKRSNFVLEDRKLASDDHQGSSFQKQKISDLNVNQEPSASSGDVIQRTTKGCSNESSQHGLDEIDENGRSKEVPEIVKVVEKNQPFNSAGQVVASGGSDWRVFEKELYLKGIEIFGTNSCRISRNLLSGLKSCAEVYSYMYNDGAAPSQRFAVASNSFSEDKDKEQESSTRSRFFRRRGRTRKLKSSWKSAGHPSSWKRIADGKNPSCKQYTPCGCRTMCGKLCSCLNNGTCCEKYCGCSKSCKNRFRGCHCAKSQCRSRQCPCFAAGRECDPDVCRNCWVSCGDDSLGEPPKRGDGLCGNMRLLLRQQQRILLARSDVAGWGAFIKNPVNKNDYLGEYTGELISHREADKRGKIYDRANSSFLFDLNDQYVLDAYRKGDKLKFANHSSNPNCYAKVMLVAGDHRVGIFAKDRIEASEELFYDYRYGPDQAPAWAQKPEGCRREDSTLSRARAKKHQSH